MQPVLPSQAPHPLTRNKKIIICTLVTLVLALVLLAGIYWKNHTGPYLKEHPLAWQVGVAVIGVVALILGCLYYQRHTAKSSQSTEPRTIPAAAVTAVATSSPSPTATATVAASVTQPTGWIPEVCDGWMKRYNSTQERFYFLDQLDRWGQNYIQYAPPENTYWSDPDPTRWKKLSKWDPQFAQNIYEYVRKS